MIYPMLLCTLELLYPALKTHSQKAADNIQHLISEHDNLEYS